MWEPLRISSQDNNTEAMTGIVSNILHWYLGEMPDSQELNQRFSFDEPIAGEPIIYLLQKGLTVRTIGLFDPLEFLERGPQHIRETVRGSWTTEQQQMFHALWTPEQVNYWQARIRQWVEAYQAAGVRQQQEIRQCRLEDIYDCLSAGGVAIIGWMLNPLESSPALVYGIDENGYFQIYCPMWSKSDCFQTRSRHEFSHGWKWHTAIYLVSP